MKDKGQGSQAGACMSLVEDTGKSFSSGHPDKTLKRNWLLLLCLLMVEQAASYFPRKDMHFVTPVSRQFTPRAGRGVALMHF